MKFHTFKIIIHRYILIAVLSFGYSGVLLAQHGWSVNAPDYQYSGDITGIVLFDDTEMTEGALGAFVGDECRGFDDSPKLAPSGYTVFQFLVYSNVSAGETLQFRFYNDQDGETYDVIETIAFTNDMILGNIINPLEFNVDNNDPPVVSNPLTDQVYQEYFISSVIDLDTVFSDPDLDPLTYSASSGSSSVVSVGVSGSKLTITEQGLGSSLVTVTATDPEVSTETSFNVIVENVNDPPIVENPIADRSEDEYFGSVVINITNVFSDKDGNVLSYLVESSDEDVATVSLDGTILRINEAGLGDAVITVSASDGFLNVEDQFSITINNVNDAPVVANPLDDVDYDEYFNTESIDFSGVFSDKDNDDLEYSVASSDETVVIVELSGTLIEVSEAGLGKSTITLSASDGDLSVDETFEISVNNVNDAPVVVNPLPDLEVTEYEGPFTVDLSDVFTDKDGDVLTLSATSGNSNVVAVSVDETELTIIEIAPGNTEITVKASDGKVSVNDKFILTLNNVNDPPVVSRQMSDISLSEYFTEQYLDISDVFFDKDMDVLTYEVESTNLGVVSVTVEGSQVKISEIGMGTSIIILTATDGEYTATDVFSVSVDNVNDQPVVDNPILPITVDEHFTFYSIDLDTVIHDPDLNDTLKFTVLSDNESVVTVGSEGSLLLINEVGLGTATISITGTDQGGLSESTDFTFTVINVNDPPYVITPVEDLELVDNIGSEVIQLNEVFADPDGDTLSYNVSVSDSKLVSALLEGGLLTIEALEAGTAEIYISAMDTSLFARDTFLVEVLVEYPLIVFHDDDRIEENDTLRFCNNADQTFIEINTNANWSYKKLGTSSWLIVSMEEDSTVSIAFSENLSGVNRYDSILISDDQGHALKFFIKQTEDCLPDGIGRTQLSDIVFYPNPVKDYLYITIDEEILTDGRIEILDNTGKQLYEAEVTSDTGRYLEIDMQQYNEGMYFIRIEGGTGYYIGKIVKL